MRDPRTQKLAELVLGYSLDVKSGETVGIQVPSVAAPLGLELYAEALRKGTHPHIMMSLEGKDEIFYSLANDEQLSHVSPFTEFEVKNLDRMISVVSSENLKELTNADPNKQAKRNASYRKLFEIYMQRFISEIGRLIILPFPTSAMAQEAGMGIREYEDFTYSACHVDEPNPLEAWRTISQKQAKLVEIFNKVEKLRIVGEDTDLSLSVKGRTWMNCDGHVNMPDGEICTSPVKESVNGSIRFTYPGIFQGKEVEDIKLIFQDGNVVEATAAKGEDLLTALLKVDDGVKMTGEIAIGTNESIHRFTNNILFDEKLGHTIHLALGSAIPMCGGKNQSAIHWDLIKDMQEGGQVYADEKIIYEEGKFLIQMEGQASSRFYPEKQ